MCSIGLRRPIGDAFRDHLPTYHGGPTGAKVGAGSRRVHAGWTAPCEDVTPPGRGDSPKGAPPEPTSGDRALKRIPQNPSGRYSSRRRGSRIGFLALAALVTGCESSGTPMESPVDPVPASESRPLLAVTPSAVTLTPGESRVLTAVLLRGRDSVEARNVRWSSDNPGVAEVDDDGAVTAISPGEALIRASSAAFQVQARVTVNPRLPDLPLVFEEHLGGGTDLRIGTMRSTGADRVHIAPGVHATWVGSTIIARGGYLDNSLYRMNPDGTGRTRIVAAGPSYVPDLAPSEDRFVFVNGDCGSAHRIAVAMADGSDLRILGPCGARPRYSPDGTRVAYFADGSLLVMDQDGRNSRVLAPAEGNDPEFSGLSWSPDGNRLAYTYQGAIWTIGLDGTGARPITEAPSGRDGSPDWSPDGDWILFSSTRTGSPELWLVRPDGSHPTQVTELGGPLILARWRR